jgi:4-amino-4-deoxy-L-arabinose transferase-like glycosyltransferase
VIRLLRWGFKPPASEKRQPTSKLRFVKGRLKQVDSGRATQSSLTQHSALSTQHFFVPLLIILVAASVQFHALVQDVRFYPDEALFSTFARSAALNGDWLLHGDLDKPPLSIYASALSMNFVAARVQNGVLDFDPRMGEFAARLPGALATIVLVAVIYALALRLYGKRSVAAWAALFASCSPYSAIYGATAYTDPIMLTLAALSILLAARGKWFWGGMWMVLAFLSKPQALYLLPLAWALGWAMGQLTARRAAAFLAPMLAGLALLVGWDGLRGQATSLLALAAANNNPARLIRSDEVVPRLTLWLNYARTLVGTPTILLSGAALLMVGGRIRREAQTRAALIDLLLLTYLLAYLLAHWLVAFNVYPRYLLPLIIPAALLAARTLGWVWAWLAWRLLPQEGSALTFVLTLTLITGAFAAGESRSDFSEDGGDYSGMIALADYLNSQSLGAVVYDHWLGWELGYYMGQWSDKRRVYYPTPEALVHDALLLDDPAPRYLVAPLREPLAPWLEALRGAGFGVERVYLQRGLAVYEVIPPSL